MSEKIIYFDCSYGISGDMTLGALVDAGVCVDSLSEMLSSLDIKGFSLKQGKVIRSGISGTKIDVVIDEKKDIARTPDEIKTIIRASSLPEIVKRQSLEAFDIIGAAEAKVHNTTIEKVHLHEVGSLDTIIDICGAFCGLYLLGVSKAFCSTITVGSGIIRAHHGEMPIPAPATAEILLGLPIESGEIKGEQTTPTGAAILKTLIKRHLPAPAFTPCSIGYGAGSREIHGKPNLLRVIIAEATENKISQIPLETQTLYKIVAEIDDMNAEFYSGIFDGALGLGALDVIVVPIIMKKSRPGNSLQILCTKDKLDVLAEYLLKNTSTFGFKVETVERYCLKRRFDVVETIYGAVDVKIGFLDGEEVKIKPEFDSCRGVAQKANVPVGKVYQSAVAGIERKFGK